MLEGQGARRSESPERSSTAASRTRGSHAGLRDGLGPSVGSNKEPPVSKTMETRQRHPAAVLTGAFGINSL